MKVTQMRENSHLSFSAICQFREETVSTNLEGRMGTQALNCNTRGSRKKLRPYASSDQRCDTYIANVHERDRKFLLLREKFVAVSRQVGVVSSRRK